MQSTSLEIEYDIVISRGIILEAEEYTGQLSIPRGPGNASHEMAVHNKAIEWRSGSTLNLTSCRRTSIHCCLSTPTFSSLLFALEPLFVYLASSPYFPYSPSPLSIALSSGLCVPAFVGYPWVLLVLASCWDRPGQIADRATWGGPQTTFQGLSKLGQNTPH